MEQAAMCKHVAANRDFRLYLEMKTRCEAITLPKAVIDTDQPLNDCVVRALNALL
jgi:hypothetical protein